MSLPANAAELKRRGYTFLETGECDACHCPVEWWRTPKKRQIPLDAMLSPDSTPRNHWSGCGKAKSSVVSGVSKNLADPAGN
jgi:hypothetical protein